MIYNNVSSNGSGTHLSNDSNRINYTKTLCLPFIALFLFTSCNSLIQDDDRVCTQEFVQSTFVIAQEGNEQPVESIQLSVVNEASDDTLDICESGTCSGNPEVEPGKYIIFHDGYLEEINRDGEEILVQGSKGDSIDFSQEYTFGHNECHIEKLAGPDTVFVSTGDE